MLSTVGIVTSSASSTSAVSSAISMSTALTAGVGGVLIAILLIMLLSSRELIWASSKRSVKILASFDSVMVPLLVLFALGVVFTVLEVGSI